MDHDQNSAEIFISLANATSELFKAQAIAEESAITSKKELLK